MKLLLATMLSLTITQQAQAQASFLLGYLVGSSGNDKAVSVPSGGAFMTVLRCENNQEYLIPVGSIVKITTAGPSNKTKIVTYYEVFCLHMTYDEFKKTLSNDLNKKDKK